MSKFTITLVCLHGPWQICKKNCGLLMSTRALEGIFLALCAKGTRVLVKRFNACHSYLSRDIQINAHEQAVPRMSVNLVLCK